MFFCSISARDGLAALAEQAIQSKSGMLHWLTPQFLNVTDTAFQKERRVYADKVAEGPFYVVADDDCIPEKGWLEKAVNIMLWHPTFAILSLWPQNASIQRWTPEGYTPYEDHDVIEHYSVGQIRVCRKGILREWPAMDVDSKAYDNIQCQAIRDAGYRVGYFKNLKVTHLGEGKTTLR